MARRGEQWSTMRVNAKDAVCKNIFNPILQTGIRAEAPLPSGVVAPDLVQ
jgi:hypothetical protein